MNRPAVLSAALAAAAAVVLVPTPAHAAPGSVWIAGTTLSYVAAPGVANRVSVTLTSDPALVEISDTAGLVSAVYPCQPVDAHKVRCPTSGVNRVQVELGDLNDVATAGTAILTHLNGQDGNDTLFASGPAPDYLHGGPGLDALYAGIRPGDVLSGDAGTDTAFYVGRTNAVRVTLDNVANDGDIATNEKDNVGTSVENVQTGDGNDQLVGSSGANYLKGGKGNDTINGGAGDDMLDGELGADTMYGDQGVDAVTYVTRTAPVRVIQDLVGDDGEANEKDYVGATIETIWGGKGDDKLSGNTGANRFFGGPGADSLSGGDGNDFFVDGAGNDAVSGGAGDDVISADAGADSINGGTGLDTVSYATRTAHLDIRLDTTANDGQANEHDYVQGSVERVYGGSAADYLVGNAGINRFHAGGGADTVYGGAGNDQLAGDAGNDYLHGGTGTDACVGGTGTNTLVSCP